MKKTSASKLASLFGVSVARGMEATIKAQLITAILKAIKKQKITHAELAHRAGMARSTVTGILSGSLQKVTIDRILVLVEAAHLTAEIKVKQAA